MSRRSQKHLNRSESPRAGSTPENQQSNGPVERATVAELAYLRWLEKGCPQGSAEEDWFEAEKELQSRGAAMQNAG